MTEPSNIVSKVGKELPNKAKSIEGQWYDYNGKFKIEPIKKQSDVDDNDRYRKYKVTVTFPTKAAVGVAFDQIELTSSNPKEHNWSNFWYHMHEDDVPAELQRLIRMVKDLRHENKKLKERNQALEKHFSLTAFEQDLQEQKHDEETPNCEKCWDVIDKKKLIEGKDWVQDSEGQYMHLECAAETYNYRCQECHLLWGEDHDEGCPECGGELKPITTDDARQALQFDALKHYLPKELLGNVQIVDPKTTQNKESKP